MLETALARQQYNAYLNELQKERYDAAKKPDSVFDVTGTLADLKLPSVENVYGEEEKLSIVKEGEITLIDFTPILGSSNIKSSV